MDEDYSGESTSENKIEMMRKKYSTILHYYGDEVRKLFIVATVIMLSTLPFLNERLPIPPFLAILTIVVLTSAAGFMKPRNKFVIYIDFIISASSVIVFSYYAIDAYNKYSITDLLFITDQVLAIIFLFALYFSAKTLRATISNGNSDN